MGGDEKGLFNAIKSFFTGTHVNVDAPGAAAAAQVEKARGMEKPPTDFAAVVQYRQAEEAMDSARWTLQDVIRNILTDATITDKQAQIGKQIDAFKAYMLSKISEVGVAKAAEMFTQQPVEKAGRKISAERLSQLKAAYSALQSILAEVEEPEPQGGQEGAGEVGKEEMAAILKDALAPLEKRLEAIEKADGATGGGQQGEGAAPGIAGHDDKGEAGSGELTADMLKGIVDEAIGSLSSRLEAIEKSRGIKKSDDSGEQGGIEKKEHYLHGIL
jgi:hypothetical protein